MLDDERSYGHDSYSEHNENESDEDIKFEIQENRLSKADEMMNLNSIKHKYNTKEDDIEKIKNTTIKEEIIIEKSEQNSTNEKNINEFNVNNTERKEMIIKKKSSKRVEDEYRHLPKSLMKEVTKNSSQQNNFETNNKRLFTYEENESKLSNDIKLNAENNLIPHNKLPRIQTAIPKYQLNNKLTIDGDKSNYYTKLNEKIRIDHSKKLNKINSPKKVRKNFSNNNLSFSSNNKLTGNINTNSPIAKKRNFSSKKFKIINEESDIRQLQKSNAELRSKLKDLNEQLNQILDRVIGGEINKINETHNSHTEEIIEKEIAISKKTLETLIGEYNTLFKKHHYVSQFDYCTQFKKKIEDIEKEISKYTSLNKEIQNKIKLAEIDFRRVSKKYEEKKKFY